ncbi:unnamed protein product [Rhodiola kirilowii]
MHEKHSTTSISTFALPWHICILCSGRAKLKCGVLMSRVFDSLMPVFTIALVRFRLLFDVV